MCVLLVEDENLIRMLLTEVMTDAGFEVLDAPDAESALAVANTLDVPQVIVTDVNLGSGMNGFTFVEAVRRLWPAVPVLLMSGIPTNFTGRYCGTDERFLSKPFSLDVFMQNVLELAGCPKAQV